VCLLLFSWDNEIKFSFETRGNEAAWEFCETKRKYLQSYKTLEVVISTGYTSLTQKEKSCTANGVVCLFHLIINKQISGREALRWDPILCAMRVYNTFDGKCGRRRRSKSFRRSCSNERAFCAEYIGVDLRETSSTSPTLLFATKTKPGGYPSNLII
jgi:hypothetical protein